MSRAAQENGLFGSLAGGIGRSVAGRVRRGRAYGKAKRTYGQELKLSAKLEATRERRQEAERAFKARKAEAADRKREKAAEKAAAKREAQQLKKEQERERKAEAAEAKREEAARRKELLDEQKERKREAQIAERERAAIAREEDRAARSYAGRMRRRPTYTQTSWEMNPATKRRTRRPRSLFARITDKKIAGVGVVDVVGVAGGIGTSKLIVKAIPFGAPDSWAEFAQQLLIAYGLHLFAPESLRRGAVAGALALPCLSLLRGLTDGNTAQQSTQTQPRQLNDGAGLSGLVDFRDPAALTPQEATAGAASVPSTVFMGYDGRGY